VESVRILSERFQLRPLDPVWHASATSEEHHQAMLNFSVKATTPLGRLADPPPVPVLLLACDDSSFFTGNELFVDGGSGQI